MEVFQKLTSKKGASLVELLIAIGVMAIFLPALATGLIYSRSGRVQEEKRVEATQKMIQASEAVRQVRENDWLIFAVNGTFHPEISGSKWQLVSGPETANDFTTRVVISDVYRDTSGNIVTTGGQVDQSTKKVDVIVAWTSPIANQVSTTSYLARFENLSTGETTQTQFNGGTKTNVKVQATSGSLVSDDGEIVLAQTGGYGDWCTPQLTFTALDLPKNGVANAVAAISGQAAVGTGDNASGVSYANVTVNDPAYPTAPVASVSGTFDGYKTNGVFTEQNFAYLATDTNSKEIVILNLLSKDSNGKYAEVGYFNAPGNGSGNSVFALGTVGYMITGSKLYTFNLASHTGSRPVLNGSGFDLGATGTKIVVVGSVAYVTTNSTTNQVKVINVANSAALSLIGNISVNGSGGVDIFVNAAQNRGYLVTSQSSTKVEFFLINLANRAVLGSYDTSAHGNMNPKGVVAVSGGRAIMVGTSGEEYQVLSLTNEANPSYCGGLNIDSGINGIATVFTPVERAYSYIITGDASSEFKIIEGGPGSGNGSYVPTGTFISQAFGPTTLTTAFNRFSANIEQPIANDVLMQVAVSDTDSNGTCTSASYTFVGTDPVSGVTGTSSYFSTSQTGETTISGPIPIGTYAPSFANPGKCFKYKAILNTTDSTLTPVFNDMTLNYSP